ncbi:hypothetical protein DFH09DRAFT_1177798 [Mycena vulgaris]|nr:hypothetical protein DFH09DRAFT_1177798 [Mycena vulgaris]
MEPDTSSNGGHDPVAAAARTLAQAMADAQRAIYAVRTETSGDKNALAAAQKKCDALLAQIPSLEAKVLALEAANRAQAEEITQLRGRCDNIATECEILREQTTGRDRRIVVLQGRLGAAELSLRQERAAAAQERVGLEDLVAREEALKADRARLGRDRAKLTKEKNAACTDRRSTVASLKRSAESLHTQIAEHERALAAMDGSNDDETEPSAPGARAQKRRRTEGGRGTNDDEGPQPKSTRPRRGAPR